MKNIIITLILSSVTIAVRAQTKQRYAIYGKQEYAIYDTLVKMHGDRIPYPNTSLETIKRFNFKNLENFDLNPKDTLNHEWKDFFNNIDTKMIHEELLDPGFLAKYPIKSNSRDFIRFSPIILSSDTTKAVCGVYSFNKYTAGAQMFLFEKKNENWVYRRSYFIFVQ